MLRVLTARLRLCAVMVLLVSAASPTVALAATYWVSPDGQATWAGCRSDAPLAGPSACSVTTANANAIGGDTIYLRGGTYSGNSFVAPTNSGAAGSRITFSAYGQENVVANNQKVPNGTHENAAWAEWNGATAQRSSLKAWDGTYATRFTTSAAGQGVRSEAFTLVRDTSGVGFYYTVRVYSDRASVNVQLRRADNVVSMEKTHAIVPNQWNNLDGFTTIPSTGAFFMTVSSTSTAPSGTFFVDGVRLNPYQPSVLLNGKDYVTVHGVAFESVIQGLDIRNGSDYNEISHSSFTDMNQTLFTINIIWNAGGAPSKYNWIHDSVFHDSGFVKRVTGPTDCDDVQTLLRIGNDTATDASGYNLIENNHFYHGGHELMIIASRYNTIRNNLLHNEGWMDNREGPCQDADGDPATFNNPSKFGNRGLLFENPGNNGGYNLVEGNRIGFSGTPPDDDGGSGIENPSDGNIVRYNFLIKNGTAGYYFKAQPGTANDVLPDNNLVYNNTIYKNGGGQDISRGYQGGLSFSCGSFYSPPNPTGNVIMNNIVYDNTIAVAAIDCAGYDYVNNLEQDPHFLNAGINNPFNLTAADFALHPTSPAIDAGAALTMVDSGDAGTGTVLTVMDARFFQDGSWGPPGAVEPDTVAIGRPDNTARIVSVDRANNRIVLASPLVRHVADKVWLHTKSDGAVVLRGAGSDIGASEFGSTGLLAPTNLRIQ